MAGAVVASMLLTACGDKATRPPDDGLRLLRVEGLTPGATARLVGRGLRELEALTVAGDTVQELAVLSDTLATFRVPVRRQCETDGRVVTLAARGAEPLQASLEVQGTVQMAVGESRVLALQDLTCIRLAARDEDYVLSVAGTGMPSGHGETLRSKLLFRTWTSANNWPESWSGFYGPVMPVPPPGPPPPPIAGGPDMFATNPTPFDARYATAQVGDIVTMVQWSGDAAQNETLCRLPREQVPTYPARVVAATSRVVIVVDTRHPQAAVFTNPATGGWLQEAANIVEPLLLPTMRSVFDPAFEPLRGGGGRYYVVLNTMAPGALGFAWDGAWPGATGASQASCPHASEMTTIRLNAATFADAQYRNPPALATLLIHEYAHHVDGRVHLMQGRPSNSSWYLNEAWAVQAEETAARLASQQPQGATKTRLTTSSPAMGSVFAGLWGRHPRLGPWQAGGRYSVSAQMLLMMRELAGEVAVGATSAPTLHQRLYASARDWTDHAATVPGLAAAVGLPYEELVDRQALASVTAGLLPPEIVAAQGLPRFRSWDLRDLAAAEGPLNPSFAGRLPRDRNYSADLLVADGGHAAVYLMADEGRGVSLEVVRGPESPAVVRLTRLR